VSDPSDTPTGTAPRRETPGPRSGTGSAGRVRASTDQGRFTPGSVIADRYRVVGLLGRGGMGEVYRADDLRLDQPVALKFLPEGVERDPERLSRFYNEARLARQVTHPAVCRVHDLGEVEGRPFLSMEYVDGEDLGSLLKRIGRLSSDKAVELALQLCAGLAAAHAQGVLHRDLKPANVMIDGQGRARITDFGLAGLAERIPGEDVSSGTPAYMSPEQLEGLEVTPRSDLYSLGLVLYELFTGRRAFEGRTLAEVMRHRGEPPPRPSELVPGFDPRIEDAIWRCLERDPALRPRSALSVAASLGGDPLATALAEGHTPSPEMVAAAGESERGLAPGLVRGCLAVVAVSVVLVPFLMTPLQLVERVPMEKEPAVLADRARQLVRELGYPEAPADSAVGWSVDAPGLRYLQSQGDASLDGLRSGAPPVLLYWYRQSPRPLVPRSASGQVYFSEPPPLVSGMVSVRLDTRGRLVSFEAVPRQVDPGEASVEPADFAPFFAAAGLDAESFRPVTSRWTPPHAYDERRAWQGMRPERPEMEIRIEAAAYRGRVTAFYPVAAWSRPEREDISRFSWSERAAHRLTAGLFLALTAMAALLARRHLKSGRADREGSFRLAQVIFLLGAAAWALGAHHLPTRAEQVELAARGLGSALFAVGVVWLFYLALEPFVRRFWPQALISWTRLLSTGPRDVLVGRDLLVGTAAGALMALLIAVALRLPGWLGYAAPGPQWSNHSLDSLISLRYAFLSLAFLPRSSIGLAAASFLVLALLRLMLRREWLAAVVYVAVMGGLAAGRLDLPAGFGLIVACLVMLDLVVVALRFGFLAFVVAAFTGDLLVGLTTTAELGSWVSEPTLFAAAVMAALATAGYRAARGRS